MMRNYPLVLGASILLCFPIKAPAEVTQAMVITARSSSDEPSTGSSALGIPPGPVLAWVERQSCSGTGPAVLIRWTPAENSFPTYTVERLDGGYSEIVDANQDGFAHLVTEGLEFGQSYAFRVVAHNHFDSTQSNIVTTYIVNEECLGAASSESAPGPFIAWMEPSSCHEGQAAVELHWSMSAGADSYTVERFASAGGSGRVVPNLYGTAFLDSLDIVPGVAHAYYLTAQNDRGTTGVQFTLPFRPRPDICSEEGLPGALDLTATPAYCSGGSPAIPISWAASDGAGDTYRYRVLGQKGSDEGGGVSMAGLEFPLSVTRGVKPDQVHQLFVVAESAVDPTKKRHSNSVFVAVPAEVCGSLAAPPEVYTQPANGITGGSAVLRSQVRANGSPTEVYFEWGTSIPYTDLTPPVAIGSTALFLQKPSRQVLDLACDTEYHYRVVAWNRVGTSIGTNSTFTTGPCPSCGESDLVISDLTVISTKARQACNSITLGPAVLVESEASLQLTAPLVVFRDGFSVKPGGSVVAGPPP